MNSKSLAWIFAILFAFAAVLAIYYYRQYQSFQTETYRLVEELRATDSTRLALEGSLQELEGSYSDKISENELLTNTLQERVKEVEQLEERIIAVRSQLSKSQALNEEINQRLEQLQILKESLENDIAALQDENIELRTANNDVALALEDTQEKIVGLEEDLEIMDHQNEELGQRLRTLAPAGFVADNFHVRPMLRNEKITSRAGRAQAIKVTFDINNVPAEYQVDEKLYLVITSFDGTPVPEVESGTVTIRSGTPIDIRAVAMDQIVLQERQSLEMSFTPRKKFKAGLYNALVYADHGFLGATSFELR